MTHPAPERRDLWTAAAPPRRRARRADQPQQLDARRAASIIVRVAARFGLRLPDIRSEGKTEEVVRARKACALALRRAGYSFPAAGRAMHRHHTAVLSLVSSARVGALALEQEDPEFAAAVAAWR